MLLTGWVWGVRRRGCLGLWEDGVAITCSGEDNGRRPGGRSGVQFQTKSSWRCQLGTQVREAAEGWGEPE